MFLVVYSDRGLVSSGQLNMKLYNTLFYLTWISYIPLDCFLTLESFAETYSLVSLLIVLSIQAVIVELMMLHMSMSLQGRCLTQRYLGAIGGPHRRNLFTANEIRYLMHFAQGCMVLEEALLGLPVSREVVKSVATVGWCFFLSICISLRGLYVCKEEPPLFLVHKEKPKKLNYFHQTTQVFTLREATIDSPKKHDRSKELIITPACAVILKKPELKKTALQSKSTIFEKLRSVTFWNERNKTNIKNSGMENCSVTINMPETIFVTPANECDIINGGLDSLSNNKLKSERAFQFPNVNYQDLDRIEEHKEIQTNNNYDDTNPMKRLEMKMGKVKREMTYPTKIQNMPDIYIP